MFNDKSIRSETSSVSDRAVPQLTSVQFCSHPIESAQKNNISEYECSFKAKLSVITEFRYATVDC